MEDTQAQNEYDKMFSLVDRGNITLLMLNGIPMKENEYKSAYLKCLCE